MAAARARAEAAGRRYPNLVDNLWAAKQFGTSAVGGARPDGEDGEP